MAEKLFDELMVRDVVSLEYNDNQFCKGAVSRKEHLSFFAIYFPSVLPGETILFSSVVYACTSMNGREHGKSVHAKAIKHGQNTSECVSAALVDFYADCIARRDAHNIKYFTNFQEEGARGMQEEGEVIKTSVGCGRDDLDFIFTYVHHTSLSTTYIPNYT
jgi:hypothetical protein